MWTYLLLVAGVIYLVYFIIKKYMSSNNDFWDKKGVPKVLPEEVATLFEVLTKKKSISYIDEEYYRRIASKHKFGGIMEFRRPVLMITDLDLLRYVLVKDFDYFMDRRKIEFGKDKIFNEMLVGLDGQRWKDVRSTLSPTFTTGKIRRMFQSFNQCGKSCVQLIKSKETVDGGHNVIIQEIVSRFTVDVIGAAAFGMETNAMKEEDSMFYKMARKMSDLKPWRLFKNVMYIVFPKLAKFLQLEVIDGDVKDFFIGILSSALKTRESSKEQRDDFLQLMIEARKGELQTDENELDTFEKEAKVEGNKKQKLIFNDDLTMAQSFLFFVAGFDTVGALVNFSAYLIAVYQDMQEKLYDEVSQYMDANNGEIDYDSVGKLEYLDMFISETLRRYPPAGRIERKCVMDYELPESGLTIPKDMLVAVSVQGIHMDPKYYPDPLTFDPERFSQENKAKRHPYAYLPFGAGPRNCIGMRFALIESKVAIAYMVYNFLIEPTAKTPVPVKIDEALGLNRPIANLELRFTPRSH